MSSRASCLAAIIFTCLVTTNGGTAVADTSCLTDCADHARVHPVADEGLQTVFDARPLTIVERRFLQSALSMTGHYNGLIDGVWGRGSQAAFEAFTADVFDDEPRDFHAGVLTTVTLGVWMDEGWEPFHLNWLSLSAMLPLDRLRVVEDRARSQVLEHRDKSLTLHLDDYAESAMIRLHSGVETSVLATGPVYRVRDPNLWITAVPTAAGTTYVRSDLSFGTWSTVRIDAGPDASPQLGLISASLRSGPPVTVLPPLGGRLVALAMETQAILDDADAPRPAVQPPAPTDRARATGMAFDVSSDGIALTNAHVVEGCFRIAVDGRPSEVIATSASFDLAALRLSPDIVPSPLAFHGGTVGLNADVTIAGFPLHGFLGGLNVNRGSVTALTGVRGDETTFQISAPVQPGNSGGPVIDRRGAVVGIVVANYTDGGTQNVGFAVRSDMARVFLTANGIGLDVSDAVDALEPENAARMLQNATRLVECF